MTMVTMLQQWDGDQKMMADETTIEWTTIETAMTWHCQSDDHNGDNKMTTAIKR